jgi:hypothetical protein
MLRALAGEAPLETTTIRFGRFETVCFAPLYVSPKAASTPRYDYALQTLNDIPNNN